MVCERFTQTLFIILGYFASRAVRSLKCFTCSQHKGTRGIECPTSASDRSVFERDRYDTVDPGVYFCSVRIAGDGTIYHQGYTIKEDCNKTEVVTHVTNLVNADTGTTGARFVCCNTDGCNWSLDTAIDNVSLLQTALPFIIAAIILLALLVICCAVCCGQGGCALCGCLGCCCTEPADKAKLDKTVNAGYQEPAININDRYRTLARPGSETSTATALTPVGSPLPGARPSGDQEAAAGNQITVEVTEAAEAAPAAAAESAVNVRASKLESVDGVPNPDQVENDRITRTARYYFQPAYKQQ